MPHFVKLSLILLSILCCRFAAGDSACAALVQTTEVPFTKFALKVLQSGNIHRLVYNLEDQYGGPSFRIPMGALFGGRTLYVLQDRALVQTVMRQESKLPFVNRNFDSSHGHFNSINSVNTSEELWKDLHENLEDIFKKKSIVPLLEKYKGILLGRGHFNLNDTLAEFYLKVWMEYCFGPQDFEKFKATRDKLVGVLGKVFHENPLNRLPYLGAATSRFNRWRYDETLKEVDEELAGILIRSIVNRQGAFYELFVRLEPKYKDALRITLDNSFLAILVYDFIHIVMLDTLAHVAKNPGSDRQAQFLESRHHAFLYPFRFRVVEADFEGFKKGDFVIVNLQRTKLYFSAGARMCPGARLFGDLAKKTLEMLDGYVLKLTDLQQEIVRSPNLDLPFMQSNHDVTLSRCPFSGGISRAE